MNNNTMTLDQKINTCPVIYDWVKFKGEVVFGAMNYEKSKAQNRVMIDIHYCATEALNNIVEKTVPYSAKNFEEAPRGFGH